MKKGQLLQIKGVYDNYKNKEGHTVSFVRAIEYKTIEKSKEKEPLVKEVEQPENEKKAAKRQSTSKPRNAAKKTTTKAKAKGNSFKEKLENEKSQDKECER